MESREAEFNAHWRDISLPWLAALRARNALQASPTMEYEEREATRADMVGQVLVARDCMRNARVCCPAGQSHRRLRMKAESTARALSEQTRHRWVSRQLVLYKGTPLPTQRRVKGRAAESDSRGMHAEHPIALRVFEGRLPATATPPTGRPTASIGAAACAP